MRAQAKCKVRHKCCKSKDNFLFCCYFFPFVVFKKYRKMYPTHFYLYLFLKERYTLQTFIWGNCKPLLQRDFWVISHFNVFLAHKATYIKSKNQVILLYYSTAGVCLPKSQCNFMVKSISRLQDCYQELILIAKFYLLIYKNLFFWYWIHMASKLKNTAQTKVLHVDIWINIWKIQNPIK